jgi:hypothetical protein
MKYTLKIPAISGDIVPLYVVAVAMAERDATAGNTPFHKPMYVGRLKRYILSLLEEVKSGSLQVCDEIGNPIPVDPNIESTARFGYAEKYVKEPDLGQLQRENQPVGDGVWNFSHLDFGPKEIDKDSPNIAWFAKLNTLNAWAEKRGDLFVISHEAVGWIDERGYVVPPAHDVRGESGSMAKRIQPTNEKTDGWKYNARTIAESLADRKKNLSLDQIAKQVREEMLKRKSDGQLGMTGRSGSVPAAGSIRRHALKGITTRRTQ